jgi:SNF2 family DNA or RNA helicase
VLLVSLKAGGTGINLTRADTVIHYDPWWNPAVESQATDRAHRIGQDQSITVYRLVCEGTVEERVLALQERKRGLTEAITRDAQARSSDGLALAPDDLELLLAPLA